MGIGRGLLIGAPDLSSINAQIVTINNQLTTINNYLFTTVTYSTGAPVTFTNFGDASQWVPVVDYSEATGGPAFGQAWGSWTLNGDGSVTVAAVGGELQNVNFTLGVVSRFLLMPDAVTGKIKVEANFQPCSIPQGTTGRQHFTGILFLATHGSSTRQAKGLGVQSPTAGGNNFCRSVYQTDTSYPTNASMFRDLGAGSPNPAASFGVRCSFGRNISGGGASLICLEQNEAFDNTDGAGWQALAGADGASATSDMAVSGYRIFMGVTGNGRRAGMSATLRSFIITQGTGVFM